MSSIRSFQSWGRCLPQNYYLLGRQKGIDRRTAPRSFAYAGDNISLLSKLSFDLERVAQWLHAFQLVGNVPDGFRDEERLDSIERRGFVCQGPELAAVTIEYRENKICQIASSVRFDPSNLVSLTDSDAKLDEMIQAVQRRSRALRDEVESELRED